MRNRFDVPRHPPDPTQRAVRQRCRFRCVICGAYPPHDYEHFRPDFVDCERHDADGITLLCLSCHGRVTRGTWSKQRVAEADQRVRDGVAHYAQPKDVEFRWPAWLVLGRAVLLGEGPLLVVGDDERIRLDRDDDGFPEITVVLRDRQGEPTFQLSRNTLVSIRPGFDFEQSGNESILRAGKGNVVLKIAYYPPELIHISRFGVMGRGIQPVNIDARQRFPIMRESVQGGELAALSGPIIFRPGGGLQVMNGCLISPTIEQDVFNNLVKRGAIEELLKKRFDQDQLVDALGMARRRGATQ